MSLGKFASAFFIVFVFWARPSRSLASLDCNQLLSKNTKSSIELLGESLSITSAPVGHERLKSIIAHQNTIRGEKKLPLLLDDLTKLSKLPIRKKRPGIYPIPAINFKEWVQIESRGRFSFINGFDDSKLINYVYIFENEESSKLVHAIPIAEFAVTQIEQEEIEIFRFMSENEFELWKSKQVETLLRHSPGGEGNWGYDLPVTHVTPFYPSPSIGAIAKPDWRCGVWRVPKNRLSAWAKNKTMSFGLNGSPGSKDYEFVIFSSVWDELSDLPFRSCSSTR